MNINETCDGCEELLSLPILLDTMKELFNTTIQQIIDSYHKNEHKMF